MRPSETAPAARCHFNFAHPVTFQSCADNSIDIQIQLSYKCTRDDDATE